MNSTKMFLTIVFICGTLSMIYCGPPPKVQDAPCSKKPPPVNEDVIVRGLAELVAEDGMEISATYNLIHRIYDKIQLNFVLKLCALITKIKNKDPSCPPGHPILKKILKTLAKMIVFGNLPTNTALEALLDLSHTTAVRLQAETIVEFGRDIESLLHPGGPRSSHHNWH